MSEPSNILTRQQREEIAASAKRTSQYDCTDLAVLVHQDIPKLLAHIDAQENMMRECLKQLDHFTMFGAWSKETLVAAMREKAQGLRAALGAESEAKHV